MRGVVLDEAVLKMAAADTVVTALEALPEGATLDVDGEPIELDADVPFGHKVAVSPHDRGDEVVKYGEAIGLATERITPGEWVHTHNCESTRGRGDRQADGGADR